MIIYELTLAGYIGAWALPVFGIRKRIYNELILDYSGGFLFPCGRRARWFGNAAASTIRTSMYCRA